MEADLVYDVGMNDGEDTAHYLSRGFRVVAVEASPQLVEVAANRFRTEVSGGRLSIVPCAISASEGEVSFYQVDGKLDWSTTDRDRAERTGLSYTTLRVPARRFRSILNEHGVPFYMKIDIEGAERLCIEGLEPPDLPAYLSFEWSSDVRVLIDQLVGAGYAGFKCISQENFLPMEIDPEAETDEVLRAAARMQRIAGLARRAGVAPVGGSEAPRVTVGGAEFAVGSSGPFAEETPGRWLAPSVVLETIDHFESQFRRGVPSPFWPTNEAAGPWADVHARLGTGACADPDWSAA